MDSSSSTDEKLELCFNGEVYPYVQELKNGGGKLAFYHDFTIFFFPFLASEIGLQKNILNVCIKTCAVAVTTVKSKHISTI